MIRFTARWFCSTMLLRHFDWRSSISRQASALTLWIAAVLAPLLSMVIFWGRSCRLMARSRWRCAAALSRLAVSKKSTLLHHRFNVAQTQRVCCIPASAHQHDFQWIVQLLEHLAQLAYRKRAANTS